MARALLGAWGLCLLAAIVGAAEPLERILARVDGQAILLGDIRVARVIGLGGVRSEDDDLTALRRLVDRQLVLNEVLRAQPPEPDATAVTREVDRFVERAGGTARLDALFVAAGLPTGYVQRLAREQVWAESYARQRFGDDPAASGRSAWTRDLRRRGTVVCTLQGC